MASDADTPQDEVPTGGAYQPGPNKYAGGGTTVDDVSPLEDRSDGTSVSAKAQFESLQRQAPS